MIKRIFMSLLIVTFSINLAIAESIDKTITKLGINKNAISVQIRDTSDGDIIYTLNSRMPMPPASTLKLITTAASINELGLDYKYKTQLYKSTNNDLYFKLSGDPLLTSLDLEDLIKVARNKDIAPKNIYIDDTLFDTNEWGEGWQWDDELNDLMPKYSIYNLNRNLLRLEITPTQKGNPASIIVRPTYPITVMNFVNTDTSGINNVKIEKNMDIPNMLNAVGTISKFTPILLPVNSPKLNFKLRLEDAIRDTKFEYFSKITSNKLPDMNIYLVSEIEHDLTPIIIAILKSSDNMMAETLFKTAGVKYSNKQGSIENSLNMLNNFFKNNHLNNEDIKIVDGSGVSKNNLMTADFMTSFLVLKSQDENFSKFIKMLPTPGEGTLKNRMLYFQNNLYAKTGTLSDTSAIAGFLTSKRGKMYAFDIMINDAKTSPSDKKNIEEQILRNLYMNY